MTNPILQLVVTNLSEPISTISCEQRDDGRWVVSIRYSGLVLQSERQVSEDCTMTVMTAPEIVQCLLPPGTSGEVVETLMREVAEVGDSRDFARNRDGSYYRTYPLRWACEYRKLSAEKSRTAYLFGDTYRIRAALKAAGLRWAPRRKAWYGPLAVCREIADQYELTLWTRPVSCKIING